MPTVIIPKILLQPPLLNQIQATFYYKYYLDASFILIESNVTINTDGTVATSPMPSFNINYDTRYTIQVQNEQCETIYEEDIFMPCDGGCPNGFVLSVDGTYCYQISTKPATKLTGSSKLVQHYTNSVYSQYGVIIFNPGGYNPNGTYTTSPTFLKTSNAGGTYANTVMANPDNNTIEGRLNVCGIWLCGNQNYVDTPLGFTRQINIPTSQQYFVGVGADNYATITLTKPDGTQIVITQDPVALATQLTGNPTNVDVAFKFWYIYPVSLLAGVNTIEMTGTNTGDNGIIGIEIYNATLAQLSNPSITETQITGTGGYAIFSTKNLVNCVDPFDEGNYSCSLYPGYSLVVQGSPSGYVCQKITTTTKGC